MARAQLLDDLGDVRISSDLQHSLDQWASGLKTQILEQAARHAISKSANRSCVLSREDLWEGAQVAFREGATEWLAALAPYETSHVRRAS